LTGHQPAVFKRPVPGTQTLTPWGCRKTPFPAAPNKKTDDSYQVKDVIMSLKPKQVTCQCGHTFTSSRDRSWCERCANAVYYHAKDKNKAKLNNMYVTGVIVAVISFLTYVFMELIATPLLSL
jgi:hypothetical protein